MVGQKGYLALIQAFPSSPGEAHVRMHFGGEQSLVLEEADVFYWGYVGQGIESRFQVDFFQGVGGDYTQDELLRGFDEYCFFE